MVFQFFNDHMILLFILVSVMDSSDSFEDACSITVSDVCNISASVKGQYIA